MRCPFLPDYSRGFRLLLLLTLGCLLALPASAQSGRKQKKSVPEPPPQGVKIPDEKKTEPAEGHSDSDAKQPEDKEKSKGPTLKFLVASDFGDINVPMMYNTIAREGCARELRRNPALQVSEGMQTTRSGAMDAAKKDEVYVILMEIVVDRFASSSRDGFELRYVLFEPKTGRQVASGFGYPAQQNGPLSMPPMGSSNVQWRVELCGRDVGRQVLSRLNAAPKGRFP